MESVYTDSIVLTANNDIMTKSDRYLQKMAENFNTTGIAAYFRPRMRIGLYRYMIAPNFNLNEITNYFAHNQASFEKRIIL